MPLNRHGSASTNPRRSVSTRTKPLVRRRPGMAISKKKARTRRDVNKKLTTLRTAVKRLQMRTYGELQLAAQAFYHRGDTVHSPDTPFVYNLCAEQPLMWCAQAIRRGSAVWQIQYDPSLAAGSRFNENQIGSFDTQKFAYRELQQSLLPDQDLRYDTLQYWANSQGVQPKYLLKNSTYELDIIAAGVSGYVELCAVSMARNFARGQNAASYTFPTGLRSYINTCKGSVDCNPISQQVTKVRCLKRMYFQYPDVQSPPAVTFNKYFGPRQQIMRLKMKHNNVIAVAVLEPNIGSGTPGGNPNQVIDWTEIPLEQQTWLMLRTSIPQAAIPGDPVPGSSPVIYYPPGHDPRKRLSCQFRRVVSWRDYLGNSLA